MSRTLITLLICCSVLFVPGLASSAKMKSFYKNPTATESSLQFKKVLVVVAIKQVFIRKVAEDKAVAVIENGGRAKAVASYTILTGTDVDNKELAKSKIEGMEFDGVILMRYAGFEDEKKYEHDDDWEDYNYFWGVYYPAWGAVYNSTRPDDTKLLIETMFYSLKDGKLIWSGITETKNPKNPAKVVGEIAEETAKHLQKQGLIGKRK